VYFGKEGNVEALTFGPGTKAAPKAAAAAQPAAQQVSAEGAASR
jgi:hypothetical protein